MTCESWREELDAYADESCPPEELAGLEDHLRTCPACATEALARIQSRRMIRAATARYAPSPEFRLKIQQSIRANEKPRGFFAKRAHWFPALASTAIALVLLAVAVTIWTRHNASEQALAELLDLHVATLASANPVDVVSTDRHTVKPWFQGKLPFTFNLPELQNTPFKLLGGKLIYFEHEPGAQLLFELRKHQLSVFIVEDHSPLSLPAAATRAAHQNGFSAETWRQSGLRYTIVSDTSPADIHALGELLRAAAGS